MLKNEVLKVVADKSGETQKSVGAVLKAFEEVVNETLANDSKEKIAFGNLGAFKCKEVPERRGTVMLGENKGSEWVKKAHKEIVFKVSSTAKDI